MAGIYEIQGEYDNVHGIIHTGGGAAPAQTDNVLRSSVPGGASEARFIASVLKELHLGNVLHEEDVAFYPNGDSLLGHIIHGHVTPVPVDDDVIKHPGHWVVDGNRLHRDYIIDITKHIRVLGKIVRKYTLRNFI